MYGVVAYKRGGGVFGDMNVRGRNAEITTAKQENSKGQQTTEDRRGTEDKQHTRRHFTVSGPLAAEGGM